MSVPDRPARVFQLDGSRYAGLNCTCAAGAMALDRHTIGKDRTTGAYVRALTGDTTGGTRLRQITDALHARWGVTLDVETPTSWDDFAARIQSGKGAILQGWAGVTHGTRWQSSETFSGNHAWYVNDHNADGYLVFDPLADGRRPAIATSPFRVPADVVREFAGKLDVSDPAEPYHALGLGHVYAAFTRDTEPHVHLRSGAVRGRPFPDRTRADESRVPVYASPSTSSDVVRHLGRGELFTSYQQTTAWLGNHNGTGWVRKSQMRRIGGST